MNDSHWELSMLPFRRKGSSQAAYRPLHRHTG